RALKGSSAAATRSTSSLTFLAAPAHSNGPTRLLMNDCSSATCMVLDSPFELAGKIAEQRPQLLRLRREALVFGRLREQRVLANVCRKVIDRAAPDVLAFVRQALPDVALASNHLFAR